MRPGHKNTSTVLSIATYSFSSVSMIILNKLLMDTFNLPYPISLLLFQNFGAFTLVSVAKHLKLLHYPDTSLQIIKRWLPLTLLFVAMLFSSMKSLQFMSVSAQTITKNLALIVTAYGDKYLFGKRITPSMVISFVLMVLGSYMGTAGDPWVTNAGVLWTAVNIAVTVLYTLYMKKLMGDVSKIVGPYGPIYYNNMLSLPIFLVCGFTEFPSFFGALLHTSTMGKLFFFVMTVISSFMTFGVFWCMHETSPTTFSVVGALNKVPVTLLGMIVFQQFPSIIGYAGIVVALLGGFLYSFGSSREAMRRAAAECAQGKGGEV